MTTRDDPVETEGRADPEGSPADSTPGEADPRLVAWCGLASRTAGWAVILIAAVTLIGWLAGAGAFWQFLPGLVTTHPAAACCFLLAGASLCLGWEADRRAWARGASTAAAVTIAGIGLVKLGEYVALLASGIDSMAVDAEGHPIGLAVPRTMPPNTAAAYLLLGLALDLVAGRSRRGVRLAQSLSLTAGLIAMLALFGYAYGVSSGFGIARFVPMALPTAASFALLALGVLFRHPDLGLMAVVTGRDEAGVIARRLLPASIVIPALLGWLRLRAQGYVLIDPEFGISTLVVANIVFFVALVWWSASLLQRIESKRRRSDEALRASEAFYHVLVESLPQNILRKDRAGRFTFANRRFCELIGHPPEEVLGKTDHDFFPEELADKYRFDDLQVMQTRCNIDTIEEHVTPDGQVHYVHVIKTPLLDPDGEAIGAQGIFWDVTAQRRVESELRLSRERFELAVRGSKDGIWDWDLRTGIVYFSPRWKAQLGYGDDELSGRFEEWERLLHPDDRGRALATVRAYLDGRLADYEQEVRMRHKDGTYRWILTRGVAIRDESGRLLRMAGSHTDITARKEAERQLAEQNERLQEMARSERRALEDLKGAQSRMVSTAKLAGLGEMVAGVAHEINNPLSYVSNNVAVLQRDLAEIGELLALYRQGDDVLAAHRAELAGRIRELCDRIDIEYTLQNLGGLLVRTRDGLRRIQQIVKDLRVFARLDESDLNEVDLNAGIESTVTIITGHAKKKGVKVQLDLAPLPAVTCYPAKINQVVMNLVSNAIDACPEDGVVTIRSRPEPQGVRVDVEDDGCGIPAEIRERIFDPFFTTKPVGIGTGLGLSISYGIVQDHGGQIEVESTPGQGTCFSIHLPTRLARRGAVEGLAAAAAPNALTTEAAP